MAKRIIHDKEILAQIPAARRRARASHPLAAKVRYEPVHRRLHVTLTNGATLLVPIDLIASLRRASDRDLADVRTGVAGVGVRWDSLDEDLSLPALARVVFGKQILLQASGAAGWILPIGSKGRGVACQWAEGWQAPQGASGDRRVTRVGRRLSRSSCKLVSLNAGARCCMVTYYA